MKEAFKSRFNVATNGGIKFKAGFGCLTFQMPKSANRSLKENNDKMEGCVSKSDQVGGYVCKIDQLQCIRIVDRFFKLVLFHRFLSCAVFFDRYLVGGIKSSQFHN